MDFLLEVIGFNIESCITAQSCGAGRIELCAAPSEGGTTPSYGFIKAARALLNIPLFVMIRPRGGDFFYSDEEISIMRDDIVFCKNQGVDGVVIGALHADGTVNKEQCTRLTETAYPMGVTFHRAFDRVNDYVNALEDVINIGCERILTSGLRPKAEAGLDTIGELVRLADRRIAIMPGSGIHSGNIVNIAKKTSAQEFHSSASIAAASQMIFSNSLMNETLNKVIVNGTEVKKMVEALSGL